MFHSRGRWPFLISLIFVSCCGPAPGELDLLPATSAGAIEAALKVPASARIELAWKIRGKGTAAASMSPELWVHREGQPVRRLSTKPCSPGPSASPACADLAGFAGQTCFLRVTSGPQTVRWTRAKLIGQLRLGASPVSWRVGPPAGKPNVVVYLIDTLRPDALSIYGGQGPTPTFDRLAAEGIVFDRAYSASTWTRPAVASLFSGLPPSGHGVLTAAYSLPESSFTLAERFRLRGYRTIGVVSNGHVSAAFNFDQGFERYTSVVHPFTPRPLYDPATLVDNPSAAEIGRQAMKELAAAGTSDRPVFLYVHVVDPHGPYRPPEWLLPEPRPALNVNNYLFRLIIDGGAATPKVLTDLALSYRGAVAYVDQELGRFLSQLGTRLDPANTIVAVTSDHGEAFFEHRIMGHSNRPFEELIRIPLVLRGPGLRPGARVTELAALQDLASTLLALADGDPPADPLRALPLPGAGWQAPSATRRAVVSEFETDIAVMAGEWKLWYRNRYPETQRFALYNLRQDPDELRNLSDAQPAVAETLKVQFRRWRARTARLALDPQPANIDEKDQSELAAKLRALGYVN